MKKTFEDKGETQFQAFRKVRKENYHFPRKK
jgi:hypothetical protein